MQQETVARTYIQEVFEGHPTHEVLDCPAIYFGIDNLAAAMAFAPEAILIIPVQCFIRHQSRRENKATRSTANNRYRSKWDVHRVIMRAAKRTSTSVHKQYMMESWIMH